MNVDVETDISNQTSDDLSFRPIDLNTQQRDHLLMENQRLLAEIRQAQSPIAN